MTRQNLVVKQIDTEHGKFDNYWLGKSATMSVIRIRMHESNEVRLSAAGTAAPSVHIEFRVGFENTETRMSRDNRIVTC